MQKGVAEIKEAMEVLAASKSTKKVEAELKFMNSFLWKMMTKIEDIQAAQSAPPSSRPFASKSVHPRQPAPHFRPQGSHNIPPSHILDADPIASLPPGIQIPGQPPNPKLDIDSD